MTKIKENLHRDFAPVGVVSHMRTSLVQGIVVMLRFKKTINLTTWQKLLRVICIYKTKDIYYWLPYRNMVDASDKYSTTGPNSRYPYAKAWFEVKETSEIYKQGLNDFVFRKQLIAQHTHELRSANTFLPSELLPVTRKKVLKMLDEFVFTKLTRRQKG